MPSATAVSQACEDVRRFLEDNALLVFDLAFTDIDMAEVIPQSHIRDKVRAASAAEIAGDRREAIALLAEAYAGRYAASPRPDFSFEPIKIPLRQDVISAILWQPAHPQRQRPPGGAHELAGQISAVTKAVQEMQEALQVMSLGIDYRQYYRFRLITPDIVYYADGHSERKFMTDDYTPTAQEFEYCRQFIITMALRIADLEVHTIEPSWLS